MITDDFKDPDLDQLLDEMEDAHVSYTDEEIDGYFLCSRNYWECLSPEDQLDLLQNHPHLEGHFAE